MRGTLNGKGYVKDGEGVFVTDAGEVYAYRDGGLTPLAAAEGRKARAALDDRHRARYIETINRRSGRDG